MSMVATCSNIFLIFLIPELGLEVFLGLARTIVALRFETHDSITTNTMKRARVMRV